MTDFVDLDVRPILRGGGEPFAKIMEAVQGLTPGQGLRLFATFKPAPLFHVLGSQGFTHEAKEIGGGDWQVEFTPAAGATERAPGARATPSTADDLWPAAARELDNRDLDPPEPMVRILAATETMTKGEVLSALLCREPIFLFPELAKRGHAWRGGFEPDGKTYRVLVRIGAAA
ncbi:MAG: DUF2249 domain-containing protein [Burkholderiales bacterium]|nr:DUF2249 domain-containing protein [Burkholderiales bacterium]